MRRVVDGIQACLLEPREAGRAGSGQAAGPSPAVSSTWTTEGPTARCPGIDTAVAVNDRVAVSTRRVCARSGSDVVGHRQDRKFHGGAETHSRSILTARVHGRQHGR